MAKIKCIIKHPEEPVGRECEIENDLKTLQRIVDGYIETVSIGNNIVIICNEEGRLRDLPYNCDVIHLGFVGTIICAGVHGEEFSDCPISMNVWKRVIGAV